MEPILQFLSNNKFVLAIMLIVFIIQFTGLQYLVQNNHSDFSYSDYEYKYFEGSLVKTIVSVLALIIGITTFGVCCLYIKIN